MPSYPAKPFEIPHDDWFNNISNNFENKSETKGTKNITTIHEFFYRQSEEKLVDLKIIYKQTWKRSHHQRSSFHLYKILREV